MLNCDFNKIAGNFIKISFWHGCFPVNLLHIFRTPFIKNTSRFGLDDLDIPKFLTKYFTNFTYFTGNILQLFYKCLHNSLPKTCKYELLVFCIFQYQQWKRYFRGFLYSLKASEKGARKIKYLCQISRNTDYKTFVFKPFLWNSKKGKWVTLIIKVCTAQKIKFSIKDFFSTFFVQCYLFRYFQLRLSELCYSVFAWRENA